MRLYFNFMIPRKRKSIAITVIVLLMTGVCLQLEVFYSPLRRTEILVWKHDFAKVTGLDLKQKGYREEIPDKNQNYVEMEPNNATFFKDETKDNSTHPKHDSSNDMKMPMYNTKTDYDESKVVFFLGGGKSGSTALATYLKHDPKNWTVWDPNGQFMDGGKELCWSMKKQAKVQFWKNFKTHGSKMAIFALDACPQAVERIHFARMVETFPNASYLMLVRDPVDRVISHMNDEMDNKDKTNTIKGNIESRLKKLKSGTSLAVRLSMFGKILNNAYSVLPRNKIMIVPTQDMTRQPQETIDKVLKHIGAKPKNVSLVEVNKRKHWNTYQIPSNTTIKWLRDMFYSDWELFKNISGLHIDTVYM